MNINLDGITIHLERKQVKNINLRITPSAQVQVSAPINCSDEIVKKFLDSKITWIKKHVLRLQNKSGIQHPTQRNDILYFLGKAYRINILLSNTKGKVCLDDDRIHMYFKKKPTLIERSALIKSWHRQQMGSLLPDLIKKWEAIIRVTVNECRIKIMKTRWGSCNTREKRIWLNLSLIQKPLICLEYVLVHEMVHLHEASHNKRFYALMDEYMPEWPAYKELLKE